MTTYTAVSSADLTTKDGIFPQSSNITSGSPDVALNINSPSATTLLSSGSGASGATLGLAPDVPSVNEGHGHQSTMNTTVFVDDAQVMTKDQEHVLHIDDTLLSMNDSQMTEASLLDFLKRPVKFESFSFNITDTFSFLRSSKVPYFPLNSAVGTIWKNKLSGYYGIRFDMRFRIVVNANKFQQGRYCMGWVPLCGAAATTSDLKGLVYNNLHMATLVQRTTVPHVEIDIASMTSAELVIPFQSVRAFYPISALFTSTPQFDLGYLNVYPYSTLVSPAGSTVAGYTIYMSLENIRLFGAASPQSGSGYANLEISNKRNGPISAPAEKVRKAAQLFKGIPMLSSYASGVAWVADKVAGVASVFGFSKPTQGDSLTKFQNLIAAGHATVDGDGDARSLGFLAKPGVTHVAGLSATDYDEMDFSYIATKYAWQQTITWSTATAVDALLTSIPVGPLSNVYTAAGTLNYTPLGFVSSFFALWRGSMKYKFKIVKTEFHSGRISVAFFPGAYTGVLTGDSTYVNRAIIDIRETQEFEIVVPYIHTDVWADHDAIVGNLVVTVVDPLVAPATVSSTISILIEVSGGPDIEFSTPTQFANAITSIAPQSGTIGSDTLYSATLGASAVNSDPVAGTAMTIGDSVTNFRSFLKRFCKIKPFNLAIASTQKLNNRALAMYVDTIPANFTTPGDFICPDAYALVASCYGIVRGGVIIRDIINMGLIAAPAASNVRALSSPVIASLGVVTNNTILAPITTYLDGTGQQTGMPVVIHDSVLNNSITVEIPQYTTTYGRATCDIMSFYGGTASYGYNNTLQSSGTRNLLYISTPVALTGTIQNVAGFSFHNVHRALADDGNFSVFISVPPLKGAIATEGSLGFY